MKIIKVLLIGTTLLFIPGKFIAQPLIGFHVGLGLSKWTIKYSDNGNALLNGLGMSINMDRISELTAGVPIEFRLSEYFSLQPELNYLTKGGHLLQNDPYMMSTLESTIKIHYIEVPVFLKYSSPGPKIKLDLFAGPALGYGLSGYTLEKQTSNGYTNTIKDEMDFKKDSISRSDFSFNFGAGASFAFGISKLFIDARYQIGITNLAAPSNSINSLFNLDVTDDTYFFTVGILTPISSGKPVPLKNGNMIRGK